jgi:hypothetical protein
LFLVVTFFEICVCATFFSQNASRYVSTEHFQPAFQQAQKPPQATPTGTHRRGQLKVESKHFSRQLQVNVLGSR